MKRSLQLLASSLAAAVVLVFSTPPTDAGRIGGPFGAISAVAGGNSLYYDIPLAAGETTNISLVGNGNSIMQLVIYDSDGHVFYGIGNLDRRTVTIDVYRAGNFRVEVRNLGINPDMFTLKTN